MVRDYYASNVVFHFTNAHTLGGMGPAMMRGNIAQNRTIGQNSSLKVMGELMTPAERLAMMDKIIDAKTPEDRQAIIVAIHAEMKKQAKENGITLPAGRGPQIISVGSRG